MKRSHFKHIMLVLLMAFAVGPAVVAQVNINAPTGLNRGTKQEPEKKVEAPASTNETPKSEGGNEMSGENSATTAKPVQPRNNSAVSAADNGNKNWVDNKKPESLNRDFSTGNSSSNLQSRQEVEMRSYGYRILVYQTNKSKNAKSNAQKRARDITVKFPQYQFYFNYKAPTWRLRVGDFIDEESAHRALKQLRQAFPMYSKEMTIIHDHINVWK